MLLIVFRRAKEKAGIVRALNERDLSSEDVVKDGWEESDMDRYVYIYIGRERERETEREMCIYIYICICVHTYVTILYLHTI